MPEEHADEGHKTEEGAGDLEGEVIHLLAFLITPINESEFGCCLGSLRVSLVFIAIPVDGINKLLGYEPHHLADKAPVEAQGDDHVNRYKNLRHWVGWSDVS